MLEEIVIKPDTPFYAYMVCDITPTLTRQAKFFSLGPTPDRLGFFGYNRELGVYVEVMSFDKPVSDAERRNAAHFEQLNLPRNQPLGYELSPCIYKDAPIFPVRPACDGWRAAVKVGKGGAGRGGASPREDLPVFRYLPSRR